jgi:expansin (peptidoglycan-binding protein)
MTLSGPTLRRLACTATLVALAACGGGGDTSTTTASAGASTTTSSGSTTTNTAAATVLGTTHSGEGTYYGATGQGACSFDASADRMVAAMNHTDYAGSAACGEYVTVTGPIGSVTVRITDVCPECAAGDIDLSAEAFAKIADPVAGRVPITWQVVAAELSGPVQYRYKEGASRYWTAIQVRNHRLPIAKLEILPSDSSSWIEVARTDYNYFVYTTAIASGALQVRITASTGAVLQDTLPEPQGGLLVEGTAQFP